MCSACGEDGGPSQGDASLPLDASTPPGDASPTDANSNPSDASQSDAATSDATTDATTDAATDAGSSPQQLPTSVIASGPSYMGSLNDSVACSASYKTRGFEPVASVEARYPLFLYFVGTTFSSTDLSSQYDNVAALKVTEAMARRGFVSLSVAYDNGALAWLSPHKNQLACLFGKDNPQSLLALACALPHVDCAQGIATWGHSQGGYVAAMAFNSDSRVRAAWATGYGGEGTATLSKHRLRIVNGEADTSNGTASSLNASTGLTPAECTQPDQCLRPDGSGWIIVRVSQLAAPATSTADHCWFDRPSCSAPQIVLEPNWVDPASSKAFALEPNADWLAATARNAQIP
jgi:hypothetical protein